VFATENLKKFGTTQGWIMLLLQMPIMAHLTTSKSNQATVSPWPSTKQPIHRKDQNRWLIFANSLFQWGMNGTIINNDHEGNNSAFNHVMIAACRTTVSVLRLHILFYVRQHTHHWRVVWLRVRLKHIYTRWSCGWDRNNVLSLLKLVHGESGKNLTKKTFYFQN